MIPIAHPLADSEMASLIHKYTKKQLEDGNLISGIRECQKYILKRVATEMSGLVVLNGSTSPMDLITHIPILCEEKKIPYVFVESPKDLNGFTCVVLKEKHEEIKYEEVSELIKKVKELK